MAGRGKDKAYCFFYLSHEDRGSGRHFFAFQGVSEPVLVYDRNLLNMYEKTKVVVLSEETGLYVIKRARNPRILAGATREAFVPCEKCGTLLNKQKEVFKLAVNAVVTEALGRSYAGKPLCLGCKDGLLVKLHGLGDERVETAIRSSYHREKVAEGAYRKKLAMRLHERYEMLYRHLIVGPNPKQYAQFAFFRKGVTDKPCKYAFRCFECRKYGWEECRGIKCETCGEFYPFINGGIEVHHKDRNPENCHIDNLSPLCKRHHEARHKYLDEQDRKRGYRPAPDRHARGDERRDGERRKIRKFFPIERRMAHADKRKGQRRTFRLPGGGRPPAGEASMLAETARDVASFPAETMPRRRFWNTSSNDAKALAASASGKDVPKMPLGRAWNTYSNESRELAASASGKDVPKMPAARSWGFRPSAPPVSERPSSVRQFALGQGQARKAESAPAANPARRAFRMSVRLPKK